MSNNFRVFFLACSLSLSLGFHHFHSILYAVFVDFYYEFDCGDLGLISKANKSFVLWSWPLGMDARLRLPQPNSMFEFEMQYKL